MKRNKSPSEDNVIKEMIEEAAKIVVPRLKSPFSYNTETFIEPRS